ncbi:hypothetical protein DIPPA_16379 [Diplonema papillatum]|nr:hypothetical protein DIPPA_16379 [Diplonema papillatum]
MAAFKTTVDAPPCRRLKSTMQLATERYDRKVLRHLKLNGGASPSAAKRPRAAAQPPPAPGPSGGRTPRARRPAASERDEAERQWAAGYPGSSGGGTPRVAGDKRPAAAAAASGRGEAERQRGDGCPGSSEAAAAAAASERDEAEGQWGDGCPGSSGVARGKGSAAAASERGEAERQWAASAAQAPLHVLGDAAAGGGIAAGGYPGPCHLSPPPLYGKTTRNPELFGTHTADPRDSSRVDRSPAFWDDRKLLEPVVTTDVGDWLRESLFMANQAEGHTTFTHALRKRSAGLKKETDARTRESRVGTNLELRNKVKEVQKEKRRIETALGQLTDEQRAQAQTRQFLIELKSMLEASAIGGCEMRFALRESRPESERTRDPVDDCLHAEIDHHKRSVDAMERLVDVSHGHLQTMNETIGELYCDLEAKVEYLRVDEQCLVLDGSSSANIHMGGASEQQPPLEIMLDAKALELIRGLGTPYRTPSSSAGRPPSLSTLQLIEVTKELVAKSLCLRKDFRKKLQNIDIEGRKLNRAVQQAFVHRKRLQEKLIATLGQRVATVQAERTRLEQQMDTIQRGLEVKNKEKDIVCKRLRLRRQLPSQMLYDKVHEALEKEYDVLTQAVQDYTDKLSHITLEISRMHDTLKAIEDSLYVKSTSLTLESKCLDLPWIHESPWPQAIYNSICNGYHAIYGAVC